MLSLRSEIRKPQSERSRQTEGRNSRRWDFSRSKAFGGKSLLVVALCLLVPGAVKAQTNVPAGQSSNRYLLVVDTSREMRRRADNVLNTVQDLLATGMRGQLRPGDTLGVWTYNTELSTGKLPLQRWSVGEEQAIAQRVLSFLRNQAYEKQASLTAVLPAIERVVRDSSCITVVLISDGSVRVNGTPFDDRINQAYDNWRLEQQKSLMPLATVLRGEAGKMTDATVSPAPWPVELPPLPSREPLPKTAQKSAPSKVVSPAKVPPLILVGKKPDTLPGTQGSGADVPEPQPSMPVSTPRTNSAEERPMPSGAAGQGIAAPSVRASASAGLPPPGQTGEPGTTAVKPVMEPVSVPVPALLQTNEPPKSSSPKPAVITQPGSSIAPTPLPAAELKPEPHPTEPASAVGLGTSASAVVRARSSSLPDLRTAASSSATAMSPQPQSHRAGLWVSSGALAIALAGLVVLLRRRARLVPRGSLITRSFERQNR